MVPRQRIVAVDPENAVTLNVGGGEFVGLQFRLRVVESKFQYSLKSADYRI